MMKYIVIFLILIITGVFFVSRDVSKKEIREDSRSLVERSYTDKIIEKTSEAKSDEKIAEGDILKTRKKAMELFQKKFGIDLSRVGISGELIFYILSSTFPKLLNVDRAEIILDKRISHRPLKSLNEISKFINSYREKLPTKIKGMLFMKLAGIKGKEEMVRDLSLNELRKFSGAPVLVIDEKESPKETKIISTSRIFETYLHSSKDSSLVLGETIDLLGTIRNVDLSRSIISTYFEVDPEKGFKLIKRLKEDGTLPPGLEAYLN